MALEFIAFVLASDAWPAEIECPPIHRTLSKGFNRAAAALLGHFLSSGIAGICNRLTDTAEPSQYDSLQSPGLAASIEQRDLERLRSGAPAGVAERE